MKESFDALVDHLMEAGLFLEQAVEILEKGMIERALALTGTNQSEAAKLLGIHRNTLQRKMTVVQHRRQTAPPQTRGTGAGQTDAPRAHSRLTECF